MAVGDQAGLLALTKALSEVVSDFLDRGLELRRVLLIAALFKKSGCKPPCEARLLAALLKSQKRDGGLVDCEDSALGAYLLSDRSEYLKPFTNALSWLETERVPGLGWGFCKRDFSRIPITALILILLPQISSYKDALSWLESTWERDLQGQYKLGYKAAWYLLATLESDTQGQDSRLFDKTIAYLVNEQRADGSWGPWKNHPAPSDYFTTGICMASLALSCGNQPDDKILFCLESALNRLQSDQLPSGLFPTHYIEEGSVWAWFGWKASLDALSKFD